MKKAQYFILFFPLFICILYSNQKEIIHLPPAGEYKEVNMKYILNQKNEIEEVFSEKFFMYLYFHFFNHPQFNNYVMSEVDILLDWKSKSPRPDSFDRISYEIDAKNQLYEKKYRLLFINISNEKMLTELESLDKIPGFTDLLYCYGFNRESLKVFTEKLPKNRFSVLMQVHSKALEKFKIDRLPACLYPTSNEKIKLILGGFE